jgi:hypothetical protein
MSGTIHVQLVPSHLQNPLSRRVRQLESIGNRAARNLAVVHIQTVTQMRVIAKGTPPSFIGDRDDKCRLLRCSEQTSKYAVPHLACW